MHTAHRQALGVKTEKDREAMSPEKAERRHRNTWVGILFIVFGLGIAVLALVVMFKTLSIKVPAVVLLVFGIGLSLYGAHMIPSQTHKADAFLKDALQSASNLLPGRGR